MNKWMLSLMPLLFLAPVPGAGAATTATTTLAVKGMTCGGCVASVKLQLRRTEGVTAYEVSLEKGEALVTFDPDKTTPEKIAASVSKTGFEASVRKAGDEKTEEAGGGSSQAASRIICGGWCDRTRAAR